MATKKKKKKKRTGEDTGWVYQVQTLRSVTVDGLTHAVAIAQHPDDRRFHVLALQTPGGTVGQILDSHAHKVLGKFKTESTARIAAERWLEKATKLKLCECAEIGA